jgi:hypothetical protein
MFDEQTMSFTDFHLKEPLMRAVQEQGFLNPTPVQEKAIPAALSGRDVVGTAQTGTGKTVAYLLPSLQALLNGASPKSPRMLVLAPTRELAIQVADEARGLPVTPACGWHPSMGVPGCRSRPLSCAAGSTWWSPRRDACWTTCSAAMCASTN